MSNANAPLWAIRDLMKKIEGLLDEQNEILHRIDRHIIEPRGELPEPPSREELARGTWSEPDPPPVVPKVCEGWPEWASEATPLVNMLVPVLDDFVEDQVLMDFLIGLHPQDLNAVYRAISKTQVRTSPRPPSMRGTSGKYYPMVRLSNLSRGLFHLWKASMERSLEARSVRVSNAVSQLSLAANGLSQEGLLPEPKGE